MFIIFTYKMFILILINDYNTDNEVSMTHTSHYRSELCFTNAVSCSFFILFVVHHFGLNDQWFNVITLSIFDIWCSAFFWVVWTFTYCVTPAELLHSALMKNHLRKRNRLKKKPLKHRRNPPWSTAPQSRPRQLKHSSARPLTLLLCAPLLPWSVRTWRLWARATASGPTAARWRRSTSHSCTNTLTRMETCRRLLTVRLASNVRRVWSCCIAIGNKNVINLYCLCVFCR